ncbi:hypothetical protein JXB37_06135, partial [candidate division WOR-3 bacterium]|nr:hypothetical protein [candidate division WOR-3 bacterium]
LFGAPMSGDRVEWSVSLSPTAFAPPGLRGYTWGPSMDEGVDEYRELATGSGRLDDLGQVEVKTRLEPGRGLRACRANLEATVTAANERGIAGRNSWLVHRSGVYVGVKADRTFAESGDTISFGVVACDPQGRLMDDVDVRVTVLRRVWKSARKSQTGGRFSWVSEPQDEKVHEFRLKTRGEEASFVYQPARPGMYWLKLEASDRRRNPARTDISFWVYGQGDASWMMRDDDLIELVRDKESYRPGDTALVLVKAPWPRCLAVVTVEREHVLDYFTVGLFGTAEVVRVPVKQEYLPNAFVSVMLLKGRTALDKFDETGADLGKPGFKMGYVELPVEPDARKLEVALAGLDEEYRPGDSVSLELEVTDSDGNGRAAEVAVAVVDLGVLKLIGYRTPDPFSVFYAPRPLSVATAELRLHVIGQRNYGEKGEAAASDGLEESGRMAGGRNGESYEFAYRQKFLETARWLPAVRTGSDGRARVGFRLPDNLTTWQVMAVAATTDRFGSGEARFRVNKPLLVLPSLPRFVRPGDEFSAGVMVHNRGEERLAVRVRARVSGGVELRGEPVVEVEVEPNKAQEVRFDYRCTGGDSAGFAFEAVAGEEQDGLKLSLPVRNPPALEAVAVYETTADSLALQWLEAPTDALPGVGGLEMTLASSGLAELERGVEWLRTYPYECLEQRLSKVLPFVLAEDLINTFKLSDLTGTRLREFCREQFVMVPKFQDESGGFHFWPNRDHWRQPSPWLSAYTMHVLYDARQAGYDIDPVVADRGRAYLANWLARDQADDWPYSTDERLTTRALAVCALGEWGGNVGAHVNTLMERLDQLSVYGKAYLLKAVARDETARSLGHDRRIVQALGNKLKLAPTTAHYEEETEGGWLFHSNVRTTAVVLQALLEAQGEVEFADKAVRWLVLERKSGRWRTTQENAMVFDALATYFRVYEKVEPDFSAEVRLAGRQALAGLFRGRSLATRRAFVGLDELARGEKQPVEVRREGSGRLYYGLRLSYAPTGKLEPR